MISDKIKHRRTVKCNDDNEIRMT